MVIQCRTGVCRVPSKPHNNPFQQLELGAELELLAVLEQGVGLGAQGIQWRTRCGR